MNMKMSTSDVKEKKMKLPPGIDPEIKKDLIKSAHTLRIDSLKMEDGVISVDFCYSKDDNYKHYTKFFDNFKEFSAYAEKFFAIQEDAKEDN